MVCPGRKIHDVLPEFAGTNVIKRSAELRQQLIEFASRVYQAGGSLGEIAELTGRTQTAMRGALDDAGVSRRGRGAQPLSSPPTETVGPE